MNVQQAINKLVDFHAWFELEADDADHDHGNPDGGNEAECPGCQWASAARDMSAIIDTLRADLVQPTPEPDWTQAPEWAQWAFLVMYTGHKFLEFRWKFTDILPERDKEWKCYVTPYDAMYYIGPTVDLPIGIDWRTTLRRRPEAENYKQEGIN